MPVTTDRRHVRVELIGDTLKARVWADGDPEPSTWNKTISGITNVTTPGGFTIDATRVRGTNTVTVDDVDHPNPTATGGTTNVASYAYDTAGRVTAETLIDGSRTYTYDTAGRLDTFTQTLPGDTRTTQLTYDTAGRIATDTTNGTTTTYTYDQASQLTAETPDSGPATTYSYDNLGRRATKNSGTDITTYAYDNASQLCWTHTSTTAATPNCLTPPPAASTYTYDNAGRRLAENRGPSDNTDYTYGPDGQLNAITETDPAGTTTHGYSYDPANQLIAIATDDGSTSTTNNITWNPNGRHAQPLAIVERCATPPTCPRGRGWIVATDGAGIQLRSPSTSLRICNRHRHRRR